MTGKTSSARRYAARVPAQERREQVLDAALSLIVEHGYRGVSMEAVARTIGVTKPVVYDLYPNLAGLLQGLLEREEAQALRQLAAAIPTTGLDADPDELLVSGVEAFLGAVVSNPDTWRLILLPANETPAEVRDHVDRGRARIVEQLQALVAWGVERRGGPVGMDVEMSAHGILALAEHMGRLVLTEPERFTPERGARFARAIGSVVPRGA
jgi:AcrR family transcriptional regulator